MAHGKSLIMRAIQPRQGKNHAPSYFEQGRAARRRWARRKLVKR